MEVEVGRRMNERDIRVGSTFREMKERERCVVVVVVGEGATIMNEREVVDPDSPFSFLFPACTAVKVDWFLLVNPDLAARERD